MKNRVQSNWILIFVLFLLCYLFSVGTITWAVSSQNRESCLTQLLETQPCTGAPVAWACWTPFPLLCGAQPFTSFFPGTPKPTSSGTLRPSHQHPKKTKQAKQTKKTKQNPVTPLIWETTAQEVLVNQCGGPGHTVSKWKNQNLQNWNTDFESKFSIPSTSIGLSQTTGPRCQACA